MDLSPVADREAVFAIANPDFVIVPCLIFAPIHLFKTLKVRPSLVLLLGFIFELLNYDFSSSSIIAKAVFLAENGFCPVINLPS